MSASYLAAPRFTDEDEGAEQSSTTHEERLEALKDLYGVMLPQQQERQDNRGGGGVEGLPDRAGDASSPRGVEEEEEPVDRGLEDLDAELCRLRRDVSASGGSGDGVGFVDPPAAAGLNVAGLDEARQRCPHITDSREHRLMFLRAEDFDVRRAAARLTNYWNERIRLFGKDKAFLPLTLSGALKDDDVSLSMGFIQLSPERDKSRRALVFVDQSKLDRTKYERNAMLRVVWYVFHAALEDETVQRCGVVFLIIPRNAQFDQFDRKLESKITQSMRDFIPLCVVGVHVCHPPGFFGLIAPNAKYLLGRKMRARLRSHTGSFRSVLEELAEFGIPSTSVPSEIGGGWAADGKWLEERRARGL